MAARCCGKTHGGNVHRGVRLLQRLRNGRCVVCAPLSLSCRKTGITGLQADPATLRLLGATAADPDHASAGPPDSDLKTTTSRPAVKGEHAAAAAQEAVTAAQEAAGSEHVEPVIGDKGQGFPSVAVKTDRMLCSCVLKNAELFATAPSKHPFHLSRRSMPRRHDSCHHTASALPALHRRPLHSRGDQHAVILMRGGCIALRRVWL
jgi:hypothetical protein